MMDNKAKLESVIKSVNEIHQLVQLMLTHQDTTCEGLRREALILASVHSNRLDCRLKEMYKVVVGDENVNVVEERDRGGEKR